ncbi:MAG: hypothetical protein JXQ90_12240 [Cyclobacteriaceae bacterium]
MSSFYIDLLFCLLTYSILIWLTIWKRKSRNSGNDNDDDDGGIPIWHDPDLDLPPGVSLPSDGPTYKKELQEELLA